MFFKLWCCFTTTSLCPALCEICQFVLFSLLLAGGFMDSPHIEKGGWQASVKHFFKAKSVLVIIKKWSLCCSEKTMLSIWTQLFKCIQSLQVLLVNEKVFIGFLLFYFCTNTNMYYLLGFNSVWYNVWKSGSSPTFSFVCVYLLKFHDYRIKNYFAYLSFLSWRCQTVSLLWFTAV